MLLPPLASGGSRPAVSIAGESLRYDELAGAAGGVAAGVAGADRVAVHATPTLDTVVAVVGALAAGVAVVPVNPASGERELAHVIADSRPDLVVASRDAVLPAPLAALPRVSPRSAGAPYRDRSAGDDERTALIIYTSGTRDHRRASSCHDERSRRTSMRSRTRGAGTAATCSSRRCRSSTSTGSCSGSSGRCAAAAASSTPAGSRRRRS